jgi:aminoglycoside 6'-N-acetyltransferase I
MVEIREAKLNDVAEWAELRASLWPKETIDEHRHELLAVLASPQSDAIGFVAVDRNGRICGFAEATLRHDYVNGCKTSPAAFLEGIYVQPDDRGDNIGRKLCSAVEAWGRERGCTELASDALLENGDSHRFHAAIGFAETERVVYFRKTL